MSWADETCVQCGGDLEWARCHLLDCEDGQYDLYDEYPISYSPGEYAACSECDSKGGSWWCPACAKQPAQEPGR